MGRAIDQKRNRSIKENLLFFLGKKQIYHSLLSHLHHFARDFNQVKKNTLSLSKYHGKDCFIITHYCNITFWCSWKLKESFGTILSEITNVIKFETHKAVVLLVYVNLRKFFNYFTVHGTVWEIKDHFHLDVSWESIIEFLESQVSYNIRKFSVKKVFINKRNS